MIIQAIQYLSPNGERKDVAREVSDTLVPQWTALTAAGLVLEMEILPERAGTADDGVPLVHVTLTDPDRGDYESAIEPNNMSVHRKVEEMIRQYDPDRLAAWRVDWDAEIEADARNNDFMRSIDGE